MSEVHEPSSEKAGAKLEVMSDLHEPSSGTMAGAKVVRRSGMRRESRTACGRRRGGEDATKG